MSAPTLALDFGGEDSTSPLDAPARLLEQVRRRGVLVQADGDKLRLDAPRGALDDLLPEIQKFKPQLLELLAPVPAQPTDDEARERFPAHLRRHFCDADRVAIGHNLLKLDRGEEIE